MNNSRTNNSLRNIGYGVVNRVVSILFPFVVRTIFIKTLGEEYLGLNSLFSSVLQVLNLADLGFASAIVASMYKPIAEGNEKKVSALMKLYKNLYRFIGVSILVVGLIITPFIGNLINGNPPADVNIYALWFLYLVNTVISYLFFAYKVSLINAHQRNDITEKIGAACRIIFSVLQIIVVLVYQNIYMYVILTVINSVVYNLWCARECDKRYPQYSCKGSLDKETKNNISKNVLALALQKIGNTVSVSLDSIVISAFLGLRIVAVYGNYFYIVTAISTFINLIYGSITASIGNSIATESKEKNLRDLYKFVFMNTWIVGWCSICFICLFQDFMTIWMGKSLLFEMPVVVFLVIRFYSEQIRKIVLTYKDAAGMWWEDKWRPVIACAVNLTFNVILVKSIGVKGVMISTIISYALIEIPWETHALFKYYFKTKEREYYLKLLIMTFKMCVACIITFSICYLIRFNTFLSLIVKGLICIFIPNIILMILNIRNKDFFSSFTFLKNIVRR